MKTELKQITSDFDGKAYWYPDVDRSRLAFEPEELEEKLGELKGLEPDEYGLYGLHLAHKLELSLPKKITKHVYPQDKIEESNKTHKWSSWPIETYEYNCEYEGFEWISNVTLHPSGEKNGLKKKRQLKLRSKIRVWDSMYGTEWAGDRVFERFSIHPESGEFVGGLVGPHAVAISAYGSYPFDEYIRLAYVGYSRNTPVLDHGVLLSRSYYSPKYNDGSYNFEKDKETTLKVLALLIKNGLPEDTKLYLSTSRDTFLTYTNQD